MVSLISISGTHKNNPYMKSKITVLLAFFFLAAYSVTAQMQRMSVEDRVKATMERLSSLNLTADQQKQASDVFKNFYTNQQKMMQQMRDSGQRPDRSTFQKAMEDRDAQLQKIFTEDQFKQFKEQEASQRQRGRRGGGNRGGGR